MGDRSGDRPPSALLPKTNPTPASQALGSPPQASSRFVCLHQNPSSSAYLQAPSAVPASALLAAKIPAAGLSRYKSPSHPQSLRPERTPPPSAHHPGNVPDSPSASRLLSPSRASPISELRPRSSTAASARTHASPTPSLPVRSARAYGPASPPGPHQYLSVSPASPGSLCTASPSARAPSSAASSRPPALAPSPDRTSVLAGPDLVASDGRSSLASVRYPYRAFQTLSPRNPNPHRIWPQCSGSTD